VNSKGQFSIIAALLVAVVLIAAVMTTYSAIRYSPLQGQPQVLSAIDEINLALKQILGFTVGYYGSVLEVTGNTSYAQMLAKNYLSSGLDNIGDVRPEWGPSFNVTTLVLNTNWFTNASYSQGTIAVKYDLTGLGISGITYSASSRLDVQVTNSNSSSQALLSVLKDENESLINLGKQDFKFYRYNYSNSTWELANPTGNIISYANGTYLIDLPSGVDGSSYALQVEDSRGIIVTASSFNHYTYSLTWNGNYSTISNENSVIELLQNGTMRWLGQSLQLTQTKPIPPIATKAIRVNQTIGGVSSEVPFQIEDWASDYRVPQGLTSNASVFSSRTMLVFLANSQVSKVTIWWDGRDIANQTSYSMVNRYNLAVNTETRTLSNGKLTMQLNFDDGFRIDTKNGSTTTSSATLMRINTKVARYGNSEPTYAIANGIVRLVVHHEVEWGAGSGDQIPNCTNVYAHIVLTLPANATYYTYQLRFMFLDSGQINRTISDFCPIKLTTSSIDQLQTENGTLSGYPVVANASGSYLYYNFSDGKWAHHWSQFVWGTGGTKGAGIMFTDSANQMLYRFDTIAGHTTGALKTDTSARTIEFLPVTSSYPARFNYALDVMWYGAVVTFDGTTPIYKLQGSTPTGLWITGEYPPTITVTAES
jgi:hypothetical protein